MSGEAAPMVTSSGGPTLVRVENLVVSFPVYAGVFRREVARVRAVDDVTFALTKGEVLGLVGESGSGKTTVGRAIANLHTFSTPDVALGGRILVGDPPVNINGLDRRSMLPLRSKIQMVFQDPYASLNPRMTVQQIIEGPLRIHTQADAAQRAKIVRELLEKVGLQASYAERYPHEFSGGQRQRIGIARALATGPDLVIADEPVSALDVSVQAQVINLMTDLRTELKLTYLFIAHDLTVVHHVADRIAVMYLGNIVEIGSADAIRHGARHPYSRALLSAVPNADPRSDRTKRIRLGGDVPTPLRKPTGCGFRSRCPIAVPECGRTAPTLALVAEGHFVACPRIDAL